MVLGQVKQTYHIVVTGLVQGVGFRPFVFRLATEMGLPGWVNNTNENVQISIHSTGAELQDFIDRLKSGAPPASRISSIEWRVTGAEIPEKDFQIIASHNTSDRITEVSPDIAVCADCLRDMKEQPSRLDYAFLNCTNCGPRFTIIQDLPYDRRNTTMKPFVMCESCASEYEDAGDRRFHAQPVACSFCGPQYELISGQERIRDSGEITVRLAELIGHGKIIAIKGQGGFHLACDAMNDQAVQKLRDSKNREGKPFAVMFRDLVSLEKYCEPTKAEKNQLLSWRRPILIIKTKKELAPDVSVGFDTIGAMLPYMPFHHLLFEKLNSPVIVLTSGNLSDEPIIIDNCDAEKILGRISDAVLLYNREIRNRTDDSVVMVMNESPRIIRRSRGYVPGPIDLKLSTEGIFAAGAELVNCFCIGKGKQAILSQHIGDLKNFETFEFYHETYHRFQQMFRLKTSLAVCDLHPDYLSTSFARELGLPLYQVQHHHAHIASVLAERGIDEKVIGVSFDGTGLGDDGKTWGSEFLFCDLEAYERFSHLAYRPMPGGDKATVEPWRMAVSYLYSIYGRDFLNMGLPFLREIEPLKLDLVIQAIEKDLNCPHSSGAGRLFDGVAALTSICTHSTFHAEAPMRLESAIRMDEKKHYPFRDGEVLDFDGVICSIIDDIKGGVDTGIIAARFHLSVVEAIVTVVKRMKKESGILKVALSGGTFQNRFISERLERRLQGEGFHVLFPEQVPANDGGIALGQLAVAAKKREEGHKAPIL